jgi:hypothetical protein
MLISIENGHLSIESQGLGGSLLHAYAKHVVPVPIQQH